MIIRAKTECTYRGGSYSNYRCTLTSSHSLWGMPESWRGGEAYYNKCHSADDLKKQEAVKTLFGICGQVVYLKTKGNGKDEDGSYTYVFDYTIYTN